MKKIRKTLKFILLILLVLILLLGGLETMYLPRYLSDKTTFDAAAVQNGSEIVVLSANVRCWSPFDLFKKNWFYRAPLIVENVRATSPDVIGFQEVTPIHYKYLTARLTGYDSVIEYRDRSPLKEGCPVFYSTVRFDLVDKGSFWLSETPDVMSKSWGAAFNRVCSYVILREKATEKELVVFNVHLDHVSDEARIGGIGVILDKIAAFEGRPAVIMGDFNCTEDSETYKNATASFYDAKYQTDDTDSGATYQNFGKKPDAENIDYFMISKTGIEAVRYKVVRNTYDGVYPSDHFPICLTMRLE